MQIRKLGTLEVSALGLGCMSMSALYGPPADKQERSNSFVLPMSVASRCSTLRSPTVHSSMRYWSERRLSRSAIRS